MHATLSKRDIRAFFEATPGIYLVLTPELVILAASDAYLHATMTTRERVVGRRLFDIFPDDSRGSAVSGVRNLGLSLERMQEDDAWLDESSEPDAWGEQSESGAFENSRYTLADAGFPEQNQRIVYVVHRVEHITELVRLKQAGAAQNTLIEALRARASTMEADVFREAQEALKSSRQVHDLQAELESRVEAHSAELQSANDELKRETVERQKAQKALLLSEEHLRQAQKLEVVGQLAGGIAHDFNNLLTAVLLYSELLLKDMGADAPGRPEVEEIQHAGERAADLTRQLLAFSRRQTVQPQILDLNEVVTTFKKIVVRMLREDVELKAMLTPYLGRVKADRGQLEQVIMNLVVNARDAMPAGGRLTIETANVELDDAYAREHLDINPGPHVMLSISDTGIGMDVETQAHAFEPFFTTKELGKGTGLGLSTVFAIVKQNGGSIWVNSEPGSGAAFTIYFPRVEGHIDSINPPPPGGSERSEGTETILLVDDEEVVLNAAKGILRSLGYHVLQARGPRDALRIVERHPVRVHLLLTDMVMPRMSGRQLADRMSELRPDIRVLFMSGYTDAAGKQVGPLEPGMAFIPKPLTPHALARRVRQALAAAPHKVTTLASVPAELAATEVSSSSALGAVQNLVKGGLLTALIL